MAIDPVALKNEILTGPLATELAVHVGPNPTKPISTSEIAKILNRVDAVNQADNFIAAGVASEAMNPADWPRIVADQWKRDLWTEIITSVGAGQGLLMNANDDNFKAKIALIFPDGSITRLKFVALQTHAVSRVQFVLGEGVDHRQVARAMKE